MYNLFCNLAISFPSPFWERLRVGEPCSGMRMGGGFLFYSNAREASVLCGKMSSDGKSCKKCLGFAKIVVYL